MDFYDDNYLHRRHWLYPTKKGEVAPLPHHHCRLWSDMMATPNLCRQKSHRDDYYGYLWATSIANDDGDTVLRTAADAAALLFLLLMVTWPRYRTKHRRGSYF